MSSLPLDQLAALRSDDVQLYLLSHGWTRDDAASTRDGSVLRFPGLPDAEVLLPRRRELADYVERMADTVQMLATVEKRNPWQLLADLSTPPADILRLQVTASDTTLGTVPLDEGLRLIEGARGMLLAAACSAHQPASFFPRQAFKNVIEFIQTCQLGQTERGSFVAKVMAPVPPLLTRQKPLFEEMDNDDAFVESEPFSRRSTIRLMTALRHIINAIDSGSYGQILNGVSEGVSANLCDAIAAMQPEGDQSHLRIRMTWSSSRPRVPKGLSNDVGFSHTSFEILKEAGRKLREQTSDSRQRIEGRVVSLKADSSLLEGFEGTIILRVDIDGVPTRVQTILNLEDYKLACDAHRDTKTVEVTGFLHREAKLYHLLKPRGFKVLPSIPNVLTDPN